MWESKVNFNLVRELIFNTICLFIEAITFLKNAAYYYKIVILSDSW